ncbi:response regulator transcription factor [Arthrobacter sp. I2-34]|uniref:Response regulator transcription factor n=1 Tax=Arthrobacter hankyongi TaxID=2904801 RepID=A0ABS9L1F5_9MICC|nr:response regulator transcription factor [Arthrobacter hankyongi]MCG2620501.1 response regulator transcription factor [Arthrobacter hankyongi]
MDNQRVAVIIEDDGDIRSVLETVLQQSGFETYAAATGADGVESVRLHQPDIITLDLGLPDFDGFEVVRQVRQFSDGYIVMLSARAEETDTLLALEAGADDYLTKPFRPRELRARVSAMLRRPRHAGSDHPGPAEPGTAANGATAEPESGALVHNGLLVDHSTRTAQLGGRDVELTRTEFDLLHALMESGRVVRTKPDLVRRLRYEHYDTGAFVSEADERAVEVHIGNLRRKLGDDPRSPRWLETVRGVGYRLAPQLQD